MKYRFPLLSILLVTALTFLQGKLLYAQSPGGPPSACSVIGIVTDSVTRQPVEYASVVVISAKDSTVKGGGVTEKGGAFQIKQLNPGQYRLRITFMGYQTWFSKPFGLSPASPQYDAGNIFIHPESTELGTVEIKEERSDYTNNIDKKVYDVGQNITNTGGTATDVLQNVPSVTVDMDGKVSLRGSENVTILIDGKPSGMTGADRQAVLQQIPASMIDRIEVITNPSAKYDAQGMAGIINIITKKEKGKGYNGTIAGGVGTGNKYNASLNLNARTDKANYFLSYSYRYEDRWSEFRSEQFNNYPDSVFTFRSEGGGLNKSKFHNVRAGTDLYFNPYNVLSVSGGYSFRNDIKADSTNYSFLDSALQYTSGFGRRAEGEDFSHTIDAALDYKKTFPGSKKTLTSSASFSTALRTVDNQYKLNSYGYENSPYQTNIADNVFYNGAWQLDYSHPIHDSLKVETGLKYTLRDYSNNQTGSLFNYFTGNYYADARFSDTFLFTEHVGAAYIQGNMHRGKWDFLAGVRSEYTNLSGVSRSADTSFVNDYINLFPNAAVRYSPGNYTELQLSYGRRLNRPGNGQLNPYIDFSDSINLRTGNPYLQPEYIHSFDLTMSQTRDKFSWSATVYYRHSTNVIQMFRIFDINTGYAVIKPRNFTSADNIGTELVFRKPFGRKGSMMISGSAYVNTINGDNLEGGLQSEAFMWNVKANATYKIFKNTNVQVNGMYFSPFIQPVGQFWMIGGLDVGIRQDIFKGKGQINANITDVFNTREFRIKNYRDEYDFNARRKRESLVFMLNFSWRFGSGDDSTPRKKNNMPQEDMQMGF